MIIKVTAKDGEVSTGVGGGFVLNWVGWDGTTHGIGFQLDLGDGSGETWDLDELDSIYICWDDGGEKE